MEKSVFKYSVDPQRVDFTGRISISSMFDLILGAAGEDAHNRGFGIDALAERNTGWVLSRICFELDSIPKEYDQIVLNTWISDYNRLSSTRNFILYDADGKEFGRAVSQWCMLDYNTRMPVDMSIMAAAHEGHMVDAPSPCERPRRLASVDSEPIVQHKVAYSDIDFNRHMNTMRYIDIVFDSMPIEVPENLNAMRMDINFIREARYGDTLQLMAQQQEALRNYEYRNSEGDVLCRMSLEVK
ncbi:MAG: acyl-ACP thioesterase [Alistipes sp.]|nr:acyl-ACP thioesterase [Alistipes sp.]